MSWRKIISIPVFSFFLTAPMLSVAGDHSVGFESSEHEVIGNSVKLHFTAGDAGVQAFQFQLPNSLKLTYGEIVTMGDFYEVVGQPIALGKSDTERKQRFVAAFNSFAQDPKAIDEAPKIINVIHFEKQTLDEGTQRGEKPEDIFKKIRMDDNRKWSCATGGGCDPKTWWMKPGRYVLEANEDFSHFGVNAVLAYQAGHQAAIDEAILANQTHDQKKLEIAYAMNALAGHYLSDRFAAGHMRTPRVELPASITPHLVGTLLVSYMHDEDNQFSLHVHNLRGDRWVSFGDCSYFNTYDAENRKLVQEAMQLSADDIFYAYQTGMAPAKDAAAELIPYPDEVGFDGHQDVASLFYWDEKTHQLFRRTDTTKPFDYHWTTNWIGWTTLIKLNQQKHLSLEAQQQLIAGGLGAKALRDGLISDANLIQFVKSN
jgi:hypothetical protein